MKWRWMLVLVGVVTAATLPYASAQTGPARSGVNIGPKAGSGMVRPDEDKAAPPNLAEIVALRMSQLEEDLRLHPGQMAAWNIYQQRVQRLLEDRRRVVREAVTASTAPQRLDTLADGARNRLAAVEDVVDAGKALYAVLTPEQRMVADRRLALPLVALTAPEVSRALR